MRVSPWRWGCEPSWIAGVRKGLTVAEIPGRAASVLVVEDDPVLTGLISLVLNRAGFVVEVAASCRHAVEAVRQRRPALVIVDLQLNQAIELCLFLKSEVSSSGVLPVVALVAPLAGPTEQRMRTHVDAVLPKPFELRRLIDTVCLLAHGSGHGVQPRIDTSAHG